MKSNTGISAKLLRETVKKLQETRQYLYVIDNISNHFYPYPGVVETGGMLCVWDDKDKKECYQVYRVSKKYKKVYLKLITISNSNI